MQTVRIEQLSHALAECVRDGVKLENRRLVKLIKDRICYDYQTIGRCEHSACHALHEVKQLATAK